LERAAAPHILVAAKETLGQPQDKILAYQGSFVKRQKVRGAANSQARCGGWQTAQQIG
jgi:hypothetical protein